MFKLNLSKDWPENLIDSNTIKSSHYVIQAKSL